MLLSAINQINNTIDAINQINGISSNLTLASDIFGNSNSAFLYSGNGDLSIPSNSFLLNNYSISVWVKPSATNSNQTIFSMGSSGITQSINFINNSNTGFIPTFQFTSTLSSGALSISFSNVVLNQWYHLVAIKEPSRIRFYINGQIVSEKGIVNNASSNYSNGPYHITLGSFNGINKFQGIIDDLKIFNGALYEEDVKDIYQQTNSNCNYVPCPTYKLVTGTNASNHRASILLEGINNNSFFSNVDFNSGKSILLNPGFNSNTNVVFKAEIKGCSTP